MSSMPSIAGQLAAFFVLFVPFVVNSYGEMEQTPASIEGCRRLLSFARHVWRLFFQ